MCTVFLETCLHFGAQCSRIDSSLVIRWKKQNEKSVVSSRREPANGESLAFEEDVFFQQSGICISLVTKHTSETQELNRFG